MMFRIDESEVEVAESVKNRLDKQIGHRSDKEKKREDQEERRSEKREMSNNSSRRQSCRFLLQPSTNAAQPS